MGLRANRHFDVVDILGIKAPIHHFFLLIPRETDTENRIKIGKIFQGGSRTKIVNYRLLRKLTVILKLSAILEGEFTTDY